MKASITALTLLAIFQSASVAAAAAVPGPQTTPKPVTLSARHDLLGDNILDHLEIIPDVNRVVNAKREDQAHPDGHPKPRIRSVEENDKPKPVIKHVVKPIVEYAESATKPKVKHVGKPKAKSIVEHAKNAAKSKVKQVGKPKVKRDDGHADKPVVKHTSEHVERHLDEYAGEHPENHAAEHKAKPNVKRDGKPTGKHTAKSASRRPRLRTREDRV